MKIKSHLLEGVQQLPSPHKSNLVIKPTLLVLHYTASGPGNDAKYFQNPKAKASAHLVIERDGTITQCVPFNIKAWHAGVSSWKGRANCNDFSIGIEIDNWGLLTKREDGTYRSHTGTIVDASEVLAAKNKLGNGGYWETYPQKQLDAVEAAIDAILESYPSITEIVGHEDIAPRRKIDPGPALYDFTRKMNNKFYAGRVDSIHSSFEKRKVIASSLNVRSNPTTTATVVGALKAETVVEVIYDGGDWSKIVYKKGEAWVYDRYLK